MLKKIMVGAIVAAGIVAPTSPALAADVSLAEPLEAIAHATGPRDAPGNSMQGIEIAASKGAKWIEIDVRWNKSDVPFAMHDATVDATTDKTGPLNSYWFQDILDMDSAMYDKWDDKKSDGSWVYPQFHGTVPNGEDDTQARVHPPSGYQFMATANAKNVNLVLDVKETPTQVQAANLMKYVDMFNMQNEVIYQAPRASITAMRGFGYTNLSYYLIENPASGTMITGETIKKLGAVGYTCYWDNVSPAFVSYYHSYGIKVFAWTTNTPTDDVPAKWQILEDAEVDGIITNQYDVLKSQL